MELGVFRGGLALWVVHFFQPVWKLSLHGSLLGYQGRGGESQLYDEAV